MMDNDKKIRADPLARLILDRRKYLDNMSKQEEELPETKKKELRKERLYPDGTPVEQYAIPEDVEEEAVVPAKKPSYVAQRTQYAVPQAKVVAAAPQPEMSEIDPSKIDVSNLSEKDRKFWEDLEAGLFAPLPEPWETAEKAKKLLMQDKPDAARILIDKILEGDYRGKRIWAGYAASYASNPEIVQKYIDEKLASLNKN